MVDIPPLLGTEPSPSSPPQRGDVEARPSQAAGLSGYRCTVLLLDCLAYSGPHKTEKLPQHMIAVELYDRLALPGVALAGRRNPSMFTYRSTTGLYG